MSATPTERESECTDTLKERQSSPELDARFWRAIQCGLGATALLTAESVLPHLVAPGASARSLGWLLRIGGLGLLGATAYHLAAIVAELWRTRPRPPREVLSPARQRLRTQLFGWTVSGGLLGGGLQLWLVHRFAVERHSATESLLGIALSWGGAAAGARAWRAWARRQGAAETDIAAEWRTRS